MAVPTQPSSASTNSAATRGGEGKGIRERSSVLGKGKGQHTEQKRTKKQQQTTLQSVCAPPIPSTSSVRAFLRVLLRPIPGPAALLSPSFLPCLRSAGESSASEGSAKAGGSSSSLCSSALVDTYHNTIIHTILTSSSPLRSRPLTSLSLRALSQSRSLGPPSPSAPQPVRVLVHRSHKAAAPAAAALSLRARGVCLSTTCVIHPFSSFPHPCRVSRGGAAGGPPRKPPLPGAGWPPPNPPPWNRFSPILQRRAPSSAQTRL